MPNEQSGEPSNAHSNTQAIHGIEFVDIKKSYTPGPLKSDTPLAVKGISFAVAPGTLTTILGPSGCGKTTTLRMIAGLEQPSAGTIKIMGKDVTGFSPAERSVVLKASASRDFAEPGAKGFC